MYRQNTLTHRVVSLQQHGFLVITAVGIMKLCVCSQFLFGLFVRL